MRHGYGVRTSAPFGMAARFRPKSVRVSMTSLRSADGGNQAPTPDPGEKRNHRIDDARGGFVLKAKSDETPVRRNSLVEKTKKGLLSVSVLRSFDLHLLNGFFPIINCECRDSKLGNKKVRETWRNVARARVAFGLRRRPRPG